MKRYQARLGTLSRFVLVHTFAHVLMRELCYECGYAAASLRERLYVFPDEAGLLIYTADGDSEGSLGGLVRQGTIKRLEVTIASALNRSRWCSNDPVCREVRGRGPGGTNLAACHACAIVSETSCTEMNGLLDRVLMVGENLPGRPSFSGYFEELLK